MRVFFTNKKQNEIQESKEVDCIDIIAEKYVIAIRLGGLEVRKRDTNEIVDNSELILDLRGE